MTEFLFELAIGGVIGLVRNEFVSPWWRRRFGMPPEKGSLNMVIFDGVFMMVGWALQSPLLVGWWTVTFLYSLWRWWTDDDNDKRRERARTKVAGLFRVFAPSPISAPAAR